MAFRASRLLLNTKKCTVLPFSNFRTSAASNAWYHFFGWPIKKEYDEKGELGFPDDKDLAVGMYKKELEARERGVEDPYGVLPIIRNEKGTKIDPILVPSALESRVLGCKCEPEAQLIVTMWLHQGEPKRCRCGYWFVLYYEPPFVDSSLFERQ